MNSTIPSIDYHDTRRAIDLLFGAKARQTALVRSPPGQGKTTMMKDYADSKGPDYGLFELNCSLANQPDYMGWFYQCEEIFKDFDGQDVKLNRGKYSYPYWWFDKRTGRPMTQFRRALIVFEEYGQCELDLKKALGQTFLERRVGQFPLPDGVDIVALTNLQGGRDAVGRDYDMLINRRVEMNYLLGEDDFLVYGQRKGMLNSTLAFAAIPNHGVFSGEVPKEQGPFLTPRSLEALDKVMQEVIDTKTSLDDPLVRTIAAGAVGMGSAHQYIALAQLGHKLPKIDDIIKDPMGTRVPSATDQMMFVIFNMADKADKKNIDSLVKYMGRMPSDMSVAFYRNALLRDKSLMSCRAFGDWAVANKTLLAVVNSRL
jgi:hypothetical protein